MSVRERHYAAIRNDDGRWHWFETHEERDRAAADAAARKRAAIAAELAERAAMWGMEP